MSAPFLPRWKIYAALAAIMIGSFLPRLATLQKTQIPSGEIVYNHREGDEVVFQTLVEQVRKNFFAYTLQGTPFLQGTPYLQRLNQQNYDHPLFMHPPLFVYTAYVLETFFRIPLPLVPVILNVLTIGIVFWIGKQMYDDVRGIWAAFLVAVCPVIWFVTQKIWLDNMLILTIATSFGVHLWATGKKRPYGYLFSGLAFSLAFLSKLTAVSILPALILISWQRDREKLLPAKAIAFFAPCLILCGGWLVLCRVMNGLWLPTAYPNAEMQKAFPFVALVVARPWYFYLTNILLLTPIYLLAGKKILTLSKPAGRVDAPLAVWILSFWIALTLFGIAGGGFQSRYFAPAYPALALLTADVIGSASSLMMILVASLIGYGLMNVVLDGILLRPQAADISDLILHAIFN